MKFNKPILFSITTTAFLALGYFGVQHFGRNAMFITAASVGGGGVISYILQKPSEQKAPAHEPEPTIAPMKTQRKAKKS